MKTKVNGRVLKNVFCTAVGGCPQDVKNLLTRKCEIEDPPTWKGLLSKCRDVQVALLDVRMKIAAYKAGGGVSITEPPVILGDREFFQAPGDPQGE